MGLFNSLKLNWKYRNYHKCPFKTGDVVIWAPEKFNPEYWNSLSEQDRLRYYGALGYGRGKKPFVFISTINDIDGDTGHCILIDLDDGHVEWMRHTCEFRKATEEEF